jgi:hypothetical protein
MDRGWHGVAGICVAPPGLNATQSYASPPLARAFSDGDPHRIAENARARWATVVRPSGAGTRPLPSTRHLNFFCAVILSVAKNPSSLLPLLYSYVVIPKRAVSRPGEGRMLVSESRDLSSCENSLAHIPTCFACRFVVVFTFSSRGGARPTQNSSTQLDAHPRTRGP